MGNPVLYVNACVRNGSRTARLAACLLQKLAQPYDEVRLGAATFPVVDEAFLDRRDRLVAAGDFSDPVFAYARQFSQAESIVIAAPYWDLSFPAVLKQYLEQVNVVGATFAYTQDGAPVGLCKAKRLFYVTTSGGRGVPKDYGFGYVRALAGSFYGIRDVRLFDAEGLDLCGADAEAALRAAEAAIAQTSLD